MSSFGVRVELAGIVVDLMEQRQAVEMVVAHCRLPRSASGPLSVVSANLDHVVQFGTAGRWCGTLGDSLHSTQPLRGVDVPCETGPMRWLTLLDGAPLVAAAGRLTGRSWPRLAGSDLIGPLLDAVQAEGLSVGFLGGSPQVQAKLKSVLPGQRPDLKVAGFWAPERSVVEDEAESLRLAAEIAAAGVDVLVVGLGKPRQELWMASYGHATGARVLLAFGAVVDFLAGSVQRAPELVSRLGVEWAWRLALEPRRLFQRYLVNDPPGLWQLRASSAVVPSSRVPVAALPAAEPGSARSRSFAGLGQPVDIAVLVVSYNNAGCLARLLDSLQAQLSEASLRVVISDNGSVDGTVALARTYPGVVVLENQANLGYAGGINIARSYAGPCRNVLVLNPDLVLAPGALKRLLRRKQLSGAGVVVPRLLDTEGAVYESLRREPSMLRALGDAVLGSRCSSRPEWASEIEYNSEAYAHPHQVQWATGAALLIDAGLERALGAWDEQFFLYSEETDYLRRVRQAGASIWFEPAAVMTHSMGGSGASQALDSLMAVNRIRYAEKHFSAAATAHAASPAGRRPAPCGQKNASLRTGCDLRP